MLTFTTFYKYPEKIKESIYTSNAIGRTNKEIRKRLRPMNSLSNIETAEKTSTYSRLTITNAGHDI